MSKKKYSKEKLSNELLYKNNDRFVKILNLISVLDVYILKSFFIANIKEKEFNLDNKILDEEVIIKIKNYFKIIHIKNITGASFVYPFDIFGTKDFKKFFEIQNEKIKKNFINYFNENLRSFQIDEKDFIDIINKINKFRNHIIYQLPDTEQTQKNNLNALQYICTLLPKKYYHEIKILFPEYKISVQEKKYHQNTQIKIKKNKPKKFINNFKNHTMVEKENFVGIDNISKIKEILRSIDFHEIDPNFFKKNFTQKNTKTFIKNIKFEEVEAIFFSFIQINYIFKKYFMRIYEACKVKENVPNNERKFFSELKKIISDKKIKDLRDRIAHSHLILGKEIIKINDDNTINSIEKKLKFSANYYREIFAIILNFFDKLFYFFKENNFNDEILNTIYCDKKSFLQSLFAVFCKSDHFVKLINNDNKKLFEKRFNASELKDLDRGKNLFENGVLKFHFYAIYKTAFRKILAEIKNENYQSITCIKIKKN